MAVTDVVDTPSPAAPGAPAVSEAVARFRERYRAEEIGPRYSGLGHFAFTLTFSTAGILACAAQVRDPSPLEWLAVPATFLYANFAEYLGHRHPMHRPFRGLGLVYRRHAGQHHRFFTDEAMPLESTRDLKAVLFPPLLVFFFFAAFAAPAGALLAWLATPNAAWLYLATAFAYFLNYELFHLAYHLPVDHPVAKLGLVKRLRRLHWTHHDQTLMTKYNFNITYPIGDWLFGTLARGSPARGAERPEA